MNPHQNEQTHKVSLSVPFSYPVHFTRASWQTGNELIKNTIAHDDGNPARILVIIDQGCADCHPKLIDDIESYCRHYAASIALTGPPLTVPGGEQVKDGWEPVNAMVAAIIKAQLCRHSYVIVIGGGAVLDAAGFAAGIVHRGIRLMRMPTTTLSQDDSGVGVKNGINLNGIKNMLGTFVPPMAVINDFDFLRTLSPEIIRDGIAEAFKVAIIKDADFFSRLDQDAAAIRNGDWKAIEAAVQRSAEIHLEHITTSEDPFEFGVSRPLDFGHWSAHMLEFMSDFSIRHGQAVAIGIALDTWYALQTGLISKEEHELILNTMQSSGLELYHPLISTKDSQGHHRLLEGIEQFREHLGGQLSITLPAGIGQRVEINELDPEIIIAGIDYLAERFKA